MIEYLIGDATAHAERPAAFVHVVNDVGLFGRGYSGALAHRFPSAARTFLAWAEGGLEGPYKLGNICVTLVGEGTTVIHLCAQHGVGRGRQRIVLDYLALCLSKIPQFVDASIPVVMPKVGTDLGGGMWFEIERVIQKNLPDHRVIVYTLPYVSA